MPAGNSDEHSNRVVASWEKKNKVCDYDNGDVDNRSSVKGLLCCYTCVWEGALCLSPLRYNNMLILTDSHGVQVTSPHGVIFPRSGRKPVR